MSTSSVTPKIVQVPSIGNIQFPGDMPDDQISAAIQKNFPQLSPKPAKNPYQEAADKIPSGTGTSISAGTQTFDQAHPENKPSFLDWLLGSFGPKSELYQHKGIIENIGKSGKQAAEAAAATGQRIGATGTSPEIESALAKLRNSQEYKQAAPATQRYYENLTREEHGFHPADVAIGGAINSVANIVKESATPDNAALAALATFVPPARVPIGAYYAYQGGKSALEPKQPDEDEADVLERRLQGAATAVGGATLGLHAEPVPIPRDLAEAAARPPINQVQKPAPIAARSLSSILGGGERAMAKRPIKQQTAAGNATNAEVRNYAASKGIDLLPGQATGAKGLQTVQAIGERTIVSPGELPEILDKQKAAFGNLIDDFKDRVSIPQTDDVTAFKEDFKSVNGREPNSKEIGNYFDMEGKSFTPIPDTESAGTSLKSQAQAGLDNLKQSAQKDYQAFQDKTGDIPVDLSDVKTKAQAAMTSQAEALKNVPAKYANPVRNVLKKLSDLQGGPEADAATLKSFNDAVEAYGLNTAQQSALRTKLGLPDEAGNTAVKMSTAQQLRSAYLDISRDYTGNVPKSVQRYAGQAAKDIDAAMAKAADTAGATDQWRQANAKWKQLQETYNNPEHPLYKVLQESDPSKVPSRLLGKGSYGGSPQTVRQLQDAGIDLSPLKREVAQQIADKNFALTNGGRGLAGYSTEFLKTLYSPAEFDELTKMGRVGRAIRFEMNPSGTSNVMEGHRQLHGILARSTGAVVGPIASRLTTSKAFGRATMGDIAPSRSLLDVISAKPPELPPDTPTSGGTPVTATSNPAAPTKPNVSEERGIKAPQKRTFERIDAKEVRNYFNYRFDQLRNEMKAAQASGDKMAIADIQRRMNELDSIQRNPKSIIDILGGK